MTSINYFIVDGLREGTSTTLLRQGFLVTKMILS
ncbi:hypothetical protein ACUXQE_002424 [Staphylococcus saprophyticus]